MQYLIDELDNFVETITSTDLNGTISILRNSYIFKRIKLYTNNSENGLNYLEYYFERYCSFEGYDLQILLLFLVLIDVDNAWGYTEYLTARTDIPLSTLAAQSFKLSLMLAS